MEYAIKGATLLLGGNLEEVKGQAVWVKEGKIRRVLPEKELPESLKTYEHNNKYLVPGLIDLHVHVMWDGSGDPVATHEKEGYEQMIIRAAANCQKYIQQGITAIRDLGSIEDIALHTAKAIDRGLINGPRLIASGKTLTMTGGHDPFWGRFCDGKDEALKGTREQIYKGAKVIKVSATGGVYGREEGEKVDHVELTFDELKVICEEAHRFGLKVASHAIGREGMKNSILAGVDTIEHGHFLDEELAGQMMEKGTAWIPTLFIYQEIARREDIPSYAREKAAQIISYHEEAFRKFFDSGILIGAGSDAGACNAPHTSLLEELKTMESFAGSRRDILKTATSNAGKILGMKLGQIETDYEADFLILKENPLDSLEALNSIDKVYKGGVEVTG
ncbi:metal-dependent hydrolase family protein [Evansella clarkii]|uniref:metal-dependent hydrolase family protein n=1 Tax=Evansella clarkii TaxID=79879 RepID=UPI000B448DFD|nr:amidohydrolase family protein [Evansella clarkii]